MKNRVLLLLLAYLIAFSTISLGSQLTVPVPIDYELVRKLLINQLYTGKDKTAHLWKDNQGCSLFDLSDPKIEGQNGLVRILNVVHARFGTGLGGQCMTLLEWNGRLETFQQPVLEEGGTILKFPVIRANAYDQQGHALKIDRMQDLIKRFAEPRLAAVKIDLRESRQQIESSLAALTTEQNKAQMQRLLDTLRFSEAKADKSGLLVKIEFDAPSQGQLASAKSTAAFTADEMRSWQAAWQQWELFLTEAIGRAAGDTQSQQLRADLQGILTEARGAFQRGLQSNDVNGKDPVRTFFLTTWDKLAPVLRRVANEVPGAEGLRYLTFIAATDVLYQIETISGPLGLTVSSDGLRQLGRLLIRPR